MEPCAHHPRRSDITCFARSIRELAGEGSILDMHETGCRIAGCMPVEPGMRLRLCLWPSKDAKDIVVAQGLVKWAKGLQFGVALDTPEWKGGSDEGLMLVLPNRVQDFCESIARFGKFRLYLGGILVIIMAAELYRIALFRL